MTDGTRRTLAELVVLHTLEPELSEVITEGRSDAAVIRWFLNRKGSKAVVYCVTDRVDVPAHEVRSRGQSVGNKGRVIAAAMSIAAASAFVSSKVTFVFDIDDDLLAGRSLRDDLVCLLHTDYRAMEMYAFARNPVDKMLKITLRAPNDLKADEVIEAITEPLVSIAFARFTLSKLTRPISMVDSIEGRCKIEGSKLTVDVETLISDSINRAGGPRTLGISKDDLMASYRQAESEDDLDARFVIPGHDFTRVCCFYLKTRFSSLFRDERLPYKTPAIFEVGLMTCLELDDLASEELFRKLAQRHCQLAA